MRVIVAFIFTLAVVGQVRAVDPEVDDFSGRWDSISLSENDQDSTDWAESFEFQGNTVTSLLYKANTTPTVSLFARKDVKPSTFTITRSVGVGNTRHIDFTRTDGSRTFGLFRFGKEPYYLYLTTRSDGKRPAMMGDGRIVLLLRSPAPNGPNLQVEDLKKMRGKWTLADPKVDKQLIKVEIKGIIQSPIRFTSYGISLTGQRIVLRPEKSPKEIDLYSDEKPVLIGIYDVEGDGMKQCFGVDKRPTGFISNDDHPRLFYELKRLK